MKIRAAVLETMGAPRPYVDSRPLVISELELEAPGPGELLVKIHVAGLCHSDLSAIDGNRPRPLPIALGHEASGVVEAVGANVTRFSPGDHVVLVFVPSSGPAGALRTRDSRERSGHAAFGCETAPLWRPGNSSPPRRLGVCRLRDGCAAVGSPH